MKERQKRKKERKEEKTIKEKKEIVRNEEQRSLPNTKEKGLNT